MANDGDEVTMQRAEDSSSRLAPEPPNPRPAFSPWIAFVLVVVLAAVAGGVVYLTRPGASQTTPSTPITTEEEPDFSLTNEEAIARFHELSEVRRRAYATADPSLIEDLYTSSSPVAEIADKELRRLRRDGVADRSRFQTLRLSILANERNRIVLRETVLVSPRFVDHTGADASRSKRTVRQVVRWTLRPEGAVWLVHDALITKAREVGA